MAAHTEQRHDMKWLLWKTMYLLLLLSTVVATAQVPQKVDSYGFVYDRFIYGYTAKL